MRSTILLAAGAGAVLASGGVHDVEGIPWAALGVTLGLIAVNALFVAMEFALLATPRTAVEPLAEAGRHSAKAALVAMGDLGRQLAGCQLGVTVASLGLGALAEPALAGIAAELIRAAGVSAGAAATAGVATGLLVVVFVHLVVGEMIPKSIALARPLGTLLGLAAASNLVVWVFRPVLASLDGMARLAAAAFGIEATHELRSIHTAAELDVLVGESVGEGLLDPSEAVRLRRALRFSDGRAVDVMIPRDQIVSVPETTAVAGIEEVVRGSGHSRILLTADRTGGVDDFVGFVHAKDLLGVDSTLRDRPPPEQMRRPVLRVPADRTLGQLIGAMRGARRQVALVSAADGGVEGLISIEDVLEALVGSISDETDVAPGDAAPVDQAPTA